jgi:hypothetical protein
LDTKCHARGDYKVLKKLCRIGWNYWKTTKTSDFRIERKKESHHVHQRGKAFRGKEQLYVAAYI